MIVQSRLVVDLETSTWCIAGPTLSWVARDRHTCYWPTERQNFDKRMDGQPAYWRGSAADGCSVADPAVMLGCVGRMVSVKLRDDGHTNPIRITMYNPPRKI